MKSLGAESQHAIAMWPYGRHLAIPHASESSFLLNHHLSLGLQSQGSTKLFEGLYLETHGSKHVFVVKHLDSEHLYACVALEECILRHRITSRQPLVG